jgi:NCAIR mutase (PurE)-related protein
VDKKNLREILERLSKGTISVDDTLEKLRHLPFEDIRFACIDHHRSLRRGVSEVIFGEGKDSEDIIAIMDSMVRQGENILVTRLSSRKAESVKGRFPESVYHKKSRTLTLLADKTGVSGKGTILVICAGTSDIPVAEEAAVTARFMGNDVETIYDVGVSGLHRILAHQESLTKASVIVVVAGMEGALPSVVGGLVNKPVIAVPTSIGY